MTAAPTVDPAIAASYARVLRRVGRAVVIQRVNGEAPNTGLVSAEVLAVIYDRGAAAADTRRYGAAEPGGLPQTDRWAVVLVADLRRARFPLPVARDDKLLVPGAGDRSTITDVDALRRGLAGALEIKAEGL